MIKRFDIGPRMSQAVKYNGTVYLAGQVDDSATDTAGQTAAILQKIDRLLVDAGTGKENILSATIWLASMNDFAAMNTVWDQWVPQGHTPARATVEAKLAAPKFLVEIAVVAAVTA